MLQVENHPSQIKSQASIPLDAAAITHTARNHHKYPGAQYALPSDDVERERLEFQHNTLKTLFGSRIVFPPIEINGSDKVLEIATGCGVWILDLAKIIDPAVPMIAVDIESRLFPTSPPQNVQFSVESVTDLPSDWTNSFSFIHQRLLLFALQVPQWPVALRELHRVLRPGGWVQIAESTGWHDGIHPGKPCMEKLTAMYRCLSRSRNIYVDCARDLPTMLKEAGFVDIQGESRMQQIGKWAGEIGVRNRINHVAIFRGLKTPILNAGGFGYVNSETQYDKLVEGLEREWDEVPGTEKEFVIFWARKPVI
ncbi:S-adenosyl-L-methionine-dependent methyltransferase [Mycena crocata]|nr:S-adenosyl-L-methionine-dependent methyltransferase [Mycena crocata]